MKAHTNDFKNKIKEFGRELDSKITYELNGETIELSNEELNSVAPHYEGGILKSVMKQLDIDSNVDIPLKTILTYQLGVKINNEYEYINFGNYVVYDVEKLEDTNSYKITCYDKMLYSMVEYEKMEIEYPITIREYLNAICDKLGLTLASIGDEFANYDREIQSELYLDSDGNSLNYTFRDVLDELAQVTASTICINNDDELEVRYITDTNDTIDEEYLKNVNVKFGEKYGPINSIVLSRAGGSDNVYLQDEESIAENGLHELKISDNQIMNFNDRSDYLPDILNKLDGLEYYINDFSSTGICYYDVCDRYNVMVDNVTYSCVMFNDDINVTQGLEEHIHTNLPEESETDYTKADKTDRRINQTYLIVDKQNQQIEALAEKVIPVSNTISGVGSITLENAYEGGLHHLTIKGPISLLFPQTEEYYGYALVPSDELTPSNNLVPSNPVPYENEVLYPSQDLYPKGTILLVDDVEYKLDFDFLNYINNDLCDEFVYEDGKCKIIRRVGINEQGQKYAFDKEVIEPRDDINIFVKGNSVIKLKSFDNAILSATYLLDNEYTENFATSVDLISRINLTPGTAEIEASKIAKLSAEKIKLEGYTTINENFGVDLEGNMWARNGSFSGNIYLESGNKVLGGDGLLSVLRFGANSWGMVGYELQTSQYEYEWIGWQHLNNSIEYFIPNNFTITEAYLVLNCTPTLSAISQAETVTGVCKQLKLYSVEGVTNTTIYYYWGGSMEIEQSDNISGVEIDNAFGPSTYTPNISTSGEVAQVISKNIAEYLDIGKQSSVVITTTVAKPPFIIDGDGSLNIACIREATQKSGAVKAELYVYGYMSLDDNG